MSYEPNVYVSAHFNDTVVFNYTHPEWQLGDYNGNYRCRPYIDWFYDQNGEVLYGQATRQPDYAHPYKMFYVAPKPQEIAYITWVVYDNKNLADYEHMAEHGNILYPYGDYHWFDETSGEEIENAPYYPFTTPAYFMPKDPGRFYAPRNWDRSIHIEGSDYEALRYLSEDQLEDSLGGYGNLHGPYSNGYMQYGGMKVNWSLWDEEEPWWSIFAPGQAYKIMAIIRYARGNGYDPTNPNDFDDSANNFYYGPSNGEDTGTIYHAPRRVGETTQSGYANMYFTRDYAGLDESKFIIFPIKGSAELSNGSGLGNVTTVKEVTTQRTVIAVRYYNLMGIESDKPFDGINIVVTFYNDGSRSSKKVMR